MEVTGGKGVEMHIEAAGDPATNIPQAEKSLAIGGKIVQIGRADKAAPVFFELYQVRSLQAYGSQGHAGEGVWPRVINLVASGRYDPLSIITARFRLTEARKALERIRSRVDAKITIKP
jgi:hypothetical protein